MEVKSGSSVALNNLSDIWKRTANLYTPRQSNNIHVFRLFPVNFAVYKSKGDYY